METCEHDFTEEDTYYCRMSFFQLIRPLTFSGTISPILVGAGFAALNGEVRWDMLFIVLIASLFVQISANLFNDYFDFKHGQDGERWTNYREEAPTYAIKHQQLPYIAGSTIIFAIILGVWISAETSWWMAVIGSIGMISGFFYSAGKYSFSALGLGEVIAAIFLGFVTTILGFVTQGHTLNLQIMVVAFTFALLISTMILTNNIRDIKKDVGFRNTVAMRIGYDAAVRLLTGILFSIYILVIVLIGIGVLPITTIFALFAAFLAFKLRKCFRKDASKEEIIQSMAWAARHHWAFGLLMALGIWLG